MSIEQLSVALVAQMLIILRFFGFLIIFPPLRSTLKISGIIICATALSLPINAFSQNTYFIAQEISSLSFAGELFLRVIAELSLGALLGIPLVIILEIFPLAARFVDVSRGAQIASQLMTGLRVNATSLESISLVVGLYLTFTQGVTFWLLDFLYKSFNLSYEHAWRLMGSREFCFSLLRTYGGILRTAFYFISPIVIVSLLIDILGAHVNRFLPRMNALFEFLPLKLLLGILVLWLLLSESTVDIAHILNLSKNSTLTLQTRESNLTWRSYGKGEKIPAFR